MDKLDKLVRIQTQLGQQIEKLHSNTKKDSVSRKTQLYIRQRQLTIDEYWDEIKVNHSEIITLNIPEHPYIKSNNFAELEKVYQKAKKYLQECPKQDDPKIESEDQEEEKNQKWRIKKQMVKIHNLQKMVDQGHLEIFQEKTKIRYETLKKTLTNQWDSILNLHEDILVFETDFQENYFINKELEICEKEYNDVINQLDLKLQDPSLNIPTQSTSKIQLPKIIIPTFDGTYENWTTFHDLYQKIIHSNISLTDVEKMQYLKTHLKGEPSRIIQHLHISDANYQTAWDLLQTRYQNNRLLLTKLLDKILDIPLLQWESSSKLKYLHDTTAECLQAIQNLGIQTTAWGPIISRILVRKWDTETNKLYEQSLNNPNEIQDFQKIMDFLRNRFQSLETISAAKKPTWNTNPTTSSFQHKENLCKYCKQAHFIYICAKFKELSVADRIQFAKNKKLCTNCLSHNTSVKCKSFRKCNTCKQAHHTLLHKDQKKTTTPIEAKSSSHISTACEKKSVLLATALVKAKTSSGLSEYIRVLIDPGSQASFITEETAQILGQPKQKVHAEVNGLADGQPKVSKSLIETAISPRFPSKYSLPIKFLVLPKLTQTMPSHQLNHVDTHSWQNKILADPTYNIPGPIDAIIGAEEYGDILLEGLQKTHDGILGQNTHLGWILSGNAIKANTNSIKITSLVSRIDEDRQLTKFWETEEISMPRNLSQVDEECEEKYKQTVIRDENGRYTVKVPFKEEPPILGTSKPKAMARLFQLEKKLSKNPDLDQQYKDFMEEYLRLGHMVKTTPSEEDDSYYIPHQAIIRPSSTTTKLRVVFDASCKTSNGESLNDKMFTGPRLQQDLSDILLRWRKHEIAFCADIEKMYRQIKITESDQDYHRVLWRFDRSKPIQEFKLTTVTYGTTAAPYLAVKTLQKLARDEEEVYPTASKIVLRDFYVDDLISGTDSLDEALKLQSELLALLKSGGFPLRKWSSNNKQVLDAIPKELKDEISLEIKENDVKKSLGVRWSPVTDKFYFKVEIKINPKITKRHILSEVAKLFDPLGWLAPVVLKAKLFIQELWVQELEWDQPVPDKIAQRWSTFHEQLKALENIQLPRWICYKKNQHIQLHGFCDASQKAYGAATYIKSTTIDGQITTILLNAKSKVAPVKTKTTLPRLELCAAVLLAKLIKKSINALEIANMPIYAWTDSTITLSWIKGDPSRWKTYVANRVTEINSLIPVQSWYHVSTEDNPADVISRGIDPAKIENHHLWWHGPKWLKTTAQWPKEVCKLETNEEIKHCHQATVQHLPDTITNLFSSWEKMTRVMSYCRRFINSSRRLPKEEGCLSVKEMAATQLQIIRIVQRRELMIEFNNIEKHGQVQKNSNLLPLNPFVDKDGILRVGGRLQKSCLPYNEKHPIIIPYHSHLAKLLIHDAHEKTLHGGNQATLAYIRRKFWILNGKRAVRQILKNCVKCIRYKAQTTTQLMGELPEPRVIASQPFLHSGVDYAGPIQVRTTKGRGHKTYKGYIAIFVCMCIKAIHLELVSDMTTDAFLAAYRRFTARRGPVAHMYSDNSTTFKGASKIFEREASSLISSSRVQDALSTKGTQWHFIPPAAPHFGGLWEAGVKSMKYHLKRIIGESTLTYEELTTLLQQIEACLNSRPLYPISNDSEELVLTPGHFLIGRPIVSPPDPITTAINTNLSTRWRVINKMKKDIWHAWSTEYLSRLQQRYKWKLHQNNLQEGNVVIIKENNIDPSKWPLARIEEVHPGTDNKIRVVTIRKPGGTISKKTIHNLIPLPATLQEDEETPNVEVRSNVTTIKSRSRSSRTSPFTFKLIMLFITLCCIPQHTVTANYSVQYPKYGLYIEHIGHAKIDRGIFRVGVKYSIAKTKSDLDEISRTVKQYEKFCKEVNELSKDTHCESFLRQLQSQNETMQMIHDGLEGIIQNRRKRGLLGNALTALFGVNDEVYKDIEALDSNQHDLIKASKHQTKFMLSALSKFNKTEIRVKDQLEEFQRKLIHGLRTIEEMKNRNADIDMNRLNIHILNTYQVANNYINELCQYYRKIVDVHLGHGNIYNLLPPTQVHQIVSSSNNKLPANIKILQFPVIKTKINHTQDNIQVYSFFPVIGITDFVVIKANPIPLVNNNGTYQILDIPNNILAIDYSTQSYFEIKENELRNTLQIKPHIYLCSATTIKNIETNFDCVINEIYQIKDNTSCPIRVNKLRTTLWKQLYMTNTWMFISPKRPKIAVICNGLREDVILNRTGIIQISQDCLIQTKHNTLAPKREDSSSVLNSFHKSITPLFEVPAQTVSNQEDEPVFRPSDALSDLKREEEDLQRDLEEKTWHRVKHHSLITNTITLAIIIISLLLVLGTYVIWKRYKSIRSSEDTSNKEPEEMALQVRRSAANADDEDEEVNSLYEDIQPRASQVQHETNHPTVEPIYAQIRPKPKKRGRH